MAALTYTWTVELLDCPAPDGVVACAFWRATASDGAHTASVCGPQAIAFDNTAPFTPYADLTPDHVLSWVRAAMGDDAMAEIEAGLAVNIANQITPPAPRNLLPWTIP